MTMFSGTSDKHFLTTGDIALRVVACRRRHTRMGGQLFLDDFFFMCPWAQGDHCSQLKQSTILALWADGYKVVVTLLL